MTVSVRRFSIATLVGIAALVGGITIARGVYQSARANAVTQSLAAGSH
jgi:hypothetical protein